MSKVKEILFYFAFPFSFFLFSLMSLRQAERSIEEKEEKVERQKEARSSGGDWEERPAVAAILAGIK